MDESNAPIASRARPAAGWRLALPAAVLLASLAVAAASIALGVGSVHADTIQINVGDNWFGTAGYANNNYVKTINAGDSVVWKFTTIHFHTVTQCTDNTYTNCTGGFDSDLRNSSSQPYTLTFDTAGTYYYICTLHVGSKGTLIVNAVATETPTPSDTATPTIESTGPPEPTWTPTDIPTPADTATSTRTPTSTPTRTPTPTPEPGTESVQMVDYSYTPKHLTIRAGDSVRWENVGAAPHTSTSNDGVWDSGIVPVGGSYTRTFNTPGEYAYYCTLHQNMGQTGTITVEGDATTTVTATPTATASAQVAVLPAETLPPEPDASAPVRAPVTFEVGQHEYAFAPSTIVIESGDTVRWVNRGSAPHNTISDVGAWASALMMQPGESFSHTFSSPGTYTYRCTLHATFGQNGTIIVRQSSVAGAQARRASALPSVGTGSRPEARTWQLVAAAALGSAAAGAFAAGARRRA